MGNYQNPTPNVEVKEIEEETQLRIKFYKDFNKLIQLKEREIELIEKLKSMECQIKK